MKKLILTLIVISTFFTSCYKQYEMPIKYNQENFYNINYDSIIITSPFRYSKNTGILDFNGASTYNRNLFVKNSKMTGYYIKWNNNNPNKIDTTYVDLNGDISIRKNKDESVVVIINRELKEVFEYNSAFYIFKSGTPESIKLYTYLNDIKKNEQKIIDNEIEINKLYLELNTKILTDSEKDKIKNRIANLSNAKPNILKEIEKIRKDIEYFKNTVRYQTTYRPYTTIIKFLGTESVIELN